MRRVYITFLLLAAAVLSLFFASGSKKIFACSYCASELHVLRAAPDKNQNQEQDNEDSQSIKEPEHTKNINAVFSKSDGSRIIENIKSQRTRTITHSDSESDKGSRNNNSSGQSESASGIYQSNITEIHQNIQQRK